MREVEEPVLKMILIETTGACNLRCIHCAVSNEGYVARTLPYEFFESLLPILHRYHPAVWLNGHGETLLHRDFLRMLDASIEAGCVVTFQTNAMLMTPEMGRKLVERAGPKSLTNMTISIDAADARLFERIRRGASFFQFLNNVRELERAKCMRGVLYPIVTFEFVAMLMNVHALPATVTLVKELGGASLMVADLQEYPTVAGESVHRNLDYAKPFFEEARRRADALGIALHLFPGILDALGDSPQCAKITSYPQGHSGDWIRVKDCTDPWNFVFVRGDGEVRPCCAIPRSLGTLKTQSFETIWHSDAYRALRAAVAGPNPPPECLTCKARGWKLIRK